MKTRRRVIICVLVLLAGSAGAQAMLRLTIGEAELQVEIADRDQTRQRGLMFRDSLPEDRGMLFVYPEARRLSFWMKNTRIALDIAFLADDGAILQISSMQPYDENTTHSTQPVRYALEVNQGWFTRHGVTRGDHVRGLPPIRPAGTMPGSEADHTQQ